MVEQMDMVSTREVISTPRILDTRKSPQLRVILIGVIMDASNDGVG